MLVDDDDAFRALLRATFEAVDVEVDDAPDAVMAQQRIAAARPDAIVMDVAMPGLDGTALCALLKAAPATRDIPIVLLTGSDMATEATAREVGADALLLKPFSPLELLAVVERVAAGLHATPFRATGKRKPDEQLLLYARDLRHLLELERGHRRLLQSAYHETVTALASALESKDHGTGEHSQRVHRYAVELAQVDRTRGRARTNRVAYGFMLHDVGKIGIPDRILQKPGPLTSTERRLMETHTVLGEQLLRGVSFLRGSGLEVVRSHHERWDGRGYPDGCSGDGDPGRGPDLRRRRRARRDDERPAVPPRDELGRRRPRARAAGGAPVRPGRGRRRSGRASARCAASGASSKKPRWSPRPTRSAAAAGRARSSSAWCQSTIFPFTTRKIAVARSPGPVAAAVLPVAELEGRTRRLAVALDRDDPPRAGQRRVPGLRFGVGAQADDVRALHDLGARREQVGRALVVVRVQRLAPRADDALGRRRALAAAGGEHCEQRAEQQGRLQASASRTSDWKCASSRSLSGSRRPSSSSPERTPAWTDSTSARSSSPTWSSKASSSSTSASETSSGKK